MGDNQEIEILKKLQDKLLPESQKEKLFEQIINKYKNKIFLLIFNIIKEKGTKEDAEEIAIETFVKFYKNISAFKFKSSLETYIRKIAINLSINFLKSKKYETISIEEASQDIKDIEFENFIDDIKQEEIREILQQIISLLPEKQKICLKLAYYENMSYKEIAEVLNTTVSSVESLLFRAKQNIKKYILKNKNLYNKLNLNG